MSNEFRNHEAHHDGSSDEPSAMLSGHGAARRDSMLSVLQGAVVREGGRRRARRLAIRKASALCVVAVLGVSLVIGWPTSMRTGRVVDTRSEEPIPQDAGKIVRLRSVPGALQRYAYVTPVDPREYIVDDQALVAVLASIGRPSGLVHRGGRVMLTSFTPDPIRFASAETLYTSPGNRK